jgi:hypothetical protein
MKTFIQFIKEGGDSKHAVGDTNVDISQQSVRDDINAVLSRVTACKYITPYNAFARITKELAYFGILLPNKLFQGEAGNETFKVDQFGSKVGMTNDGKVVSADPSPYSIYFEYNLADCGHFDIFCELVDDAELKQIKTDVEDELED